MAAWVGVIGLLVVVSVIAYTSWYGVEPEWLYRLHLWWIGETEDEH